MARYKLLISRGKLAAYEAQGDNMIHPAVDPSLLGKADFSTTFLPAGFDAQLLRQGMMNCHAGSCELLLEPE